MFFCLDSNSIPQRRHARSAGSAMVCVFWYLPIHDISKYRNSQNGPEYVTMYYVHYKHYIDTCSRWVYPLLSLATLWCILHLFVPHVHCTGCSDWVVLWNIKRNDLWSRLKAHQSANTQNNKMLTGFVNGFKVIVKLFLPIAAVPGWQLAHP